MKRIINGRLWDDTFMNEIGSRSYDVTDRITQEVKQYRERLYREYVLKPGHTLQDTWIEGQYGRHIVKDNCDLTKGQFLLKVSQGWGDGIFILLTDEEARQWFEKWMPDSTDAYAEVFGQPENPWTGDGVVDLVAKAESRMNSMKWDKERAEERANKAEAEIADLRKKLEAMEAGLS